MDYFLKRFEKIYANFLFSMKIYQGDRDQLEQCTESVLKEYDKICHQYDGHDRFAKQLRSVAADFKHKVKWQSRQMLEVV